MSKETLQHTMRSKVRVFEDGGIRLLRKGQKGLIHAIFSRFGLVLVLLVLQFGALFSLMRWFSNLLPHYLGGTLLVTAAMMVYLLNQDMNNSVRIPWLVVTALAPVLGVLLCTRYALQSLGQKVLPLFSSVIELVGKVIFVLVFIPKFQYNAVILCEPIIWCFMTAYLVAVYLHEPFVFPKK